MKYIPIVLIILTAQLYAFGQSKTPKFPLDDKTGLITFSDVLHYDGKTKEELYTILRMWFAKTFVSANHVIQMEDKDAGILVGKALTKVFHKTLLVVHDHGHIIYTMSIYVKDNRFKYEINNFYHEGNPINSVPDYGRCEDMINTKHKTMGISNQKMYNQYLNKLMSDMEELVKDLKAHMDIEINRESSEW
jgi:hypothetical protein